MVAVGERRECRGPAGFSARDDPAVDVEEELLERVGKPFGMAAGIVADRGGGRSEQGRVAFQDLIRADAASPSQRRLGDSLSQKAAPSVAAISIVRRFLRPAVTWET